MFKLDRSRYSTISKERDLLVFVQEFCLIENSSLECAWAPNQKNLRLELNVSSPQLREYCLRLEGILNEIAARVGLSRVILEINHNILNLIFDTPRHAGDFGRWMNVVVDDTQQRLNSIMAI